MKRLFVAALAVLLLCLATHVAAAQDVPKIDGFSLGMSWSATASTLPCRVHVDTLFKKPGPPRRDCSVNDSVTVTFFGDTSKSVWYVKSRSSDTMGSVEDEWRSISGGMIRLLGKPDSVIVSMRSEVDILTVFWAGKPTRVWSAYACVHERPLRTGFLYSRELTIQWDSEERYSACY